MELGDTQGRGGSRRKSRVVCADGIRRDRRRLGRWAAVRLRGGSRRGRAGRHDRRRATRRHLGWITIVEEGALGFAIATLARSQLAGIGAGIAFYFGEAFAGVFLPDIVKYGPFSVASASLGTSGGFGGGGGGEPAIGALSQETAFLLVGVWLVGALLVAALVTDRAEITG